MTPAQVPSLDVAATTAWDTLPLSAGERSCNSRLGEDFFVADAFGLPPDGEPIGPMAPEVTWTVDAAGATRVRVTHTGFKESARGPC